jgi:hypothetical protein
VQLARDIDGERAGEFSGWAVTLSSDGSAVAVGAPFNSGSDGGFSGHVRVYSLDVSQCEVGAILSICI